MLCPSCLTLRSLLLLSPRLMCRDPGSPGECVRSRHAELLSHCTKATEPQQTLLHRATTSVQGVIVRGLCHVGDAVLEPPGI